MLGACESPTSWAGELMHCGMALPQWALGEITEELRDVFKKFLPLHKFSCLLKHQTKLSGIIFTGKAFLNFYCVAIPCKSADEILDIRS